MERIISIYWLLHTHTFHWNYFRFSIPFLSYTQLSFSLCARASITFYFCLTKCIVSWTPQRIHIFILFLSRRWSFGETIKIKDKLQWAYDEKTNENCCFSTNKKSRNKHLFSSAVNIKTICYFRAKKNHLPSTERKISTANTNTYFKSVFLFCFYRKPICNSRFTSINSRFIRSFSCCKPTCKIHLIWMLKGNIDLAILSHFAVCANQLFAQFIGDFIVVYGISNLTFYLSSCRVHIRKDKLSN